MRVQSFPSLLPDSLIDSFQHPTFDRSAAVRRYLLYSQGVLTKFHGSKAAGFRRGSDDLDVHDPPGSQWTARWPNFTNDKAAPLWWIPFVSTHSLALSRFFSEALTYLRDVWTLDGRVPGHFLHCYGRRCARSAGDSTCNSQIHRRYPHLGQHQGDERGYVRYSE
jgi:hypothetical protein